MLHVFYISMIAIVLLQVAVDVVHGGAVQPAPQLGRVGGAPSTADEEHPPTSMSSRASSRHGGHGERTTADDRWHAAACGRALVLCINR